MELIDRVLDYIESCGSAAPGKSGATGRPQVTLSYAQSLDGSLTHRRGAPLALSGPESLQLTHRLRAAHQAILVGIGTVLADNPQLSVRLAPGSSPQPIILDSQLRVPLDSRLLRPETGAPGIAPWIATTNNAEAHRATALESAGARLIRLPPDDQGCVPLPRLMGELAASGIASLMVEGGARVLQAFLSARLADRVVLTLSPLFVGGLKAIEEPLAVNSSMDMNAPDLAAQDFPHLDPMNSAELGGDLIVWGEIRYPTP